MPKNWLAGIALGFLLNMVSCSNSTSPDELNDNTVIAVINKKEIHLDHFKKELEFHKKKFRVHEGVETSQEELLWLKNRTLEQIVQKTLFRQEAKKIILKSARTN